eukprot:TRINITY_DN3566_c0_g1_i2.p1 TRINITY_DN3566_c0_g1~~TRINITY_DN3566_c0_g1_i2.p1  ORF type:complete len:625 (+),score=195.14 TRINITY_DN3566_c0_g1_i2:106-1980(+)
MVRFGDFLGEHATQYSGLIDEERYLNYEHLKELIYGAPESFLEQFVVELGKLRHFLEGQGSTMDKCQLGCPCRIPEQKARMHFMRMNREGCRKILKKFDKTTSSTAGPEYMRRVDELFGEYLTEEELRQVKAPVPERAAEKPSKAGDRSERRVNDVYAALPEVPQAPLLAQVPALPPPTNAAGLGAAAQCQQAHAQALQAPPFWPPAPSYDGAPYDLISAFYNRFPPQPPPPALGMPLEAAPAADAAPAPRKVISTPGPVVHIRWLECRTLPIGLLHRSVVASTVERQTKIKADRQVIHTTQDYLILDPHNKGRYLIPAGLVDDTAGRGSYESKPQSFVCMLHQKGGKNGHKGCNAHQSCNQMHVRKEAIAILRRAAEDEEGYTVAVEGNFVVELRGILDPVTGQRHVFPYHRTEHTAGRVAYAKAAGLHRSGTGPAPDMKLCPAYLDGHCPHGKACPDIHAIPPFVAQLRHGYPCCSQHQPGRCTAPPDDVALKLARPASSKKDAYDVPIECVSVTRGLTAVPVKQGKAGPFKCFSSGKLCRLHSENRCEFGARCNNIHICREWKPSQPRKAADCAPAKSAGSGGRRAKQQPQPQPQPQPQRGDRRADVLHSPYLTHPPIALP